MSYRIEIIVVDDTVPLVAADRPEVVQSMPIGPLYGHRDDAVWLADEYASWCGWLLRRIPGIKRRGPK